MLNAYLTLAVYALGSYDGDFDNATNAAFEAYIGRTTSYEAITVAWTLDEDVIEQNSLRIQTILEGDKQPVLIWDPVLPRNYDDSMQAIILGLCDQYIIKFFDMIAALQTTIDFTPIVQIGTQVNTGQSYAENATAFIQVY
jgi:hypothetical protein